MAPRNISAFARANAARIRRPEVELRLQSQRHSKRQRIERPSNDFEADNNLASQSQGLENDLGNGFESGDDNEGGGEDGNTEIPEDDDEMPLLLQAVADSEDNVSLYCFNLSCLY